MCYRLPSSHLVLSVLCLTAITVPGCATSPATSPPAYSNVDPLDCAAIETSSSPLSEVEGALQVHPLEEDELNGSLDDDEASAQVGLRLAFPAPKGWTTAWLQRRVICHQQTQAQTPDDVLAVRNVRVSVAEQRGRFLIDVIGRDQDAVVNINRAATALVERLEQPRLQAEAGAVQTPQPYRPSM